ncbi:MAG: VCBS repeat-containing protein [Deltaproteobacteria bacterium]|nr:VCBS repeat-containing protein [Deltaproteobacteria bacterium]
MKNLLFILLSSLAVISCDWRVFDDLKSEATVQVINAPENFGDANFGQISSHLLDSSGNKYQNILIIGGSGDIPLFIINFSNGEISKHPVKLPGVDGLEVSNIIPLVPYNSEFLLGLSSLGKIYIVSIDKNPDAENEYTGTVEKSIDEMENISGFGRALDIYQNSNRTYSVIAASDNHIHYFETMDSAGVDVSLGDFNLTSTENNTFSSDFIKITEFDDIPHLIVGGTETDTNFWSIQIFSVYSSLLEVVPEERIILKGSEAYPGDEVSTIRLFDINNDDIPDIIAGCGDSIFVFQSENDSISYSSVPDVELYSTDRSLGKSIEIIDLDGDGTMELISTDPGIETNGSSGEVYIFKMPFTISKISPAVTIGTPENEKLFGSSLAGVPSSEMPDREELIVGGLNTLYLFYITGFEGDSSTDDDPRNIE